VLNAGEEKRARLFVLMSERVPNVSFPQPRFVADIVRARFWLLSTPRQYAAAAAAKSWLVAI